MSEIALGFGAYERTGNPTLVCKNLYAESVLTPSGSRLQLRARPGLASFKTVGSGQLRGIGFRDGLFDNSAIVVSGAAVYTLTAAGVLTALTGAVAGDDLVDIAFGQDADLNSVAYIASGGALYKVLNGLVTQDTSFPEAGASSVDFIAGNFVASASGTDKFYYLAPAAVSWEPLDFQSAEYAPDPLVAVRTRGDQLAMLGSSTFQVFALSGDGNNPFAPYGGLDDDFGCRARATAVNCVGTLMFVDSRCNVRRWDGGVPGIVSAPGLAKLIAEADSMDLVAWTFTIPGHRFYVLRLSQSSTWVYDLDGEGGALDHLRELRLRLLAGQPRLQHRRRGSGVRCAGRHGLSAGRRSADGRL
ncbi:hypothetical protein [Phenylobacterium sp. J367]|uniref:hypothetical protein n=1 Tax=Phenylobacterium sp. J367 TaxID=2898435 RepID=UPI002150CBCF|nr:hypothetical protein [Phenylobacterium sp. J367]MCR5876995.1 hypothetical protein [Phenylobacterium sp. J367]